MEPHNTHESFSEFASCEKSENKNIRYILLPYTG